MGVGVIVAVTETNAPGLNNITWSTFTEVYFIAIWWYRIVKSSGQARYMEAPFTSGQKPCKSGFKKGGLLHYNNKVSISEKVVSEQLWSFTDW